MRKLKWGISLEQIGLNLLFYTKKEATKAMCDIDKMGELTKADVISYARTNNISYGFHIKDLKK